MSTTKSNIYHINFKLISNLNIFTKFKFDSDLCGMDRTCQGYRFYFYVVSNLNYLLKFNFRIVVINLVKVTKNIPIKLPEFLESVY